jgi:hypothetical protein
MWYIIPTILLITTLTGKSIRHSDGPSPSYYKMMIEEDWQNIDGKSSRGIEYGSIEEGNNQQENIRLTGLNR